MKKILLVEDDKFLVRLYRKKLADAGYEVKMLESGVTTLDEVKQFKPQLIILDMILPEKDGFSVLTELKNNDETKHIPILILTYLGMEEDRKRALKLGADYYFVKSSTKFDEIITLTTKIVN